VLGGDEEMRKKAFRYASFALIVSTILLLPQVARAATIFGASSGGKTEAQYCGADVWFIAIPVSLDVNEGDKITIWFNASWYDNRSAGSSLAVHYFRVNYTYGADSGEEYIYRYSTGGNVGLYSPFSLTTKELHPYGTVGITWLASITIAAPNCFDSDSKVHNIGLA
jgi:hypothetical protein